MGVQSISACLSSYIAAGVLSLCRALRTAFNYPGTDIRVTSGWHSKLDDPRNDSDCACLQLHLGLKNFCRKVVDVEGHDIAVHSTTIKHMMPILAWCQ